MRMFLLISVALFGSAATAQDRALRTLTEHSIEPNAESITEYLRTLVNQTDDRDAFSSWVVQLSDSSFAIREAATQRLLNAPVVHLDLLEPAIKSSDLEVRFRAQTIVDALHKRPPAKRREDVLRAVLSVIAEQEIKGVAAPLLPVIPMCDDPLLAHRAAQALEATVQEADIPALRVALGDKSPALRSAAITGLGQLLGDAVGEDAAQLAGDPMDSVRLSAARALANMGDRRSLSALVQLLGAEQATIRARSVHILRQLSGRQLGYSAFDKEELRATSAKKWLAWIDGEGENCQTKFSGARVHCRHARPGTSLLVRPRRQAPHRPKRL